ncbi:GNAT family N-acetyltransferase [Parvimonas micra]|uniref:GNAT family N-acetyltransferase n=1 Tax=Parvimonas micra TaxID=33033 RepID=UPI0022B72A43|nr:GNAT family N-acetyltransferase [Parvimonas micra]WBB34412.1 GNAT family N-acetyltransferase [Parvimonas micra]WBB35933.1 GNAT family N-acetyltransferase [Parvimonas micra]
MLFLKEINIEDAKKEYIAITSIPEDENGFVNKFYNVSFKEFVNEVIPKCEKESKGIDLKSNRVPQNYYFLWDDDEIVGLFKVRKKLNDSLREGAGHIGYGIIKKYRKRGYATRGLKLVIELIKDEIEEDEIYMSVNKNNPYSLKTQLNCGAYIFTENEDQYFTRIKI